MTRRVAAGIVLTGLATTLAWAYELPVRDSSLREAYFLGRRRDEKTAAFLSRYVRRLPLPKTGPHVAEIELRTPYAQVVLRARNAPDGYSSQQAARDYRARPQALLLRVLLYLTPTYPAHSPMQGVPMETVELRPETFWREFSFGLYQEEKEVRPRKVAGRPLYGGNGFGVPGLAGAEVDLEFDAADVASTPARVVVLTPDGQRVEAEFDLERLR